MKRQLPILASYHVSGLQRLGLLLGFSMLILTSFLFYVCSSNMLLSSIDIVAVFLGVIIMLSCCVWGFLFLAGDTTRPSSGPEIENVLTRISQEKYDDLEVRINEAILNSYYDLFEGNKIIHTNVVIIARMLIIGIALIVVSSVMVAV